MARILLIAVFSLFPLSAWAEWRLGPGSEIFVGTTSAFVETNRGGGFGVLCREGVPFLWTQGWAPAQGGADRTERFSVTVDGRAYELSGTHTPPDGMWTATPSPSLIAALQTGASAVISTQTAGSASVSLRGSSRALSNVLEGCNGDVASASDPMRIVAFDRQIVNACGGGYRLAEGAEQSGLLDGDDQPDVVLDWAGVICDDRSKGRGAGFCGAALCTVDVLLTETGQRKQILGLNPVLIRRAFGAQALQTTTQGATCGGPAQVCDVLWVWNGTELEAQK